MTKMLLKKVYRAMWSHKKAYLACIFLIAIGVMMRIAMGVAGDGLENAKLSFYDDYRLAHVFARVGAVPVNDIDRLRDINGVLDVSARTVLDVRAELEGSDELITLRLISFDPAAEYPLNHFQIVSGLTPSFPNDIAINYMFIDANALSPQDTISLIIQGRTFNYEISGAFLSPEYIYIAPSFTDILPDNAGFGIAYITDEAMANITGRPGIANEVLFILQDGYDFEDMRHILQDALHPYGLVSLNDRMGLISYSLLDMQVSGIQSVATSLPFVFVAMSVVVLYLMMKRIIEQERTQIGTLKAFGYSNQDLILHYLCYGGITGLIGGLIGFAYGAPMSALYLSIFLEFFILPDLVQPVDFSYFIFAMAVSLGGGMLGAFMGALKILELNPAEAMKPEAPKPVKNDIIGKIKVLRLILTSRGQMSLRGIIRHPVRSGFVILGVTFSFGLLVVFGSMANIMDAMIYAQFRDIRVYDMRVTLTQPMAYNTAVEAAHGIPHITRAEGILELPATLRSRHLQTGTLVTGISGDGQLFRVFDTTSRTAYPPPRDSLIITNGLADALNVSTGDVIYIGSPLMRDDVPIPVSQIIEQSVGSGAFMEIGAMSALFDQPMTASSIIFTTNDLPFVRDYFRESQNTANIEDVGGTLQKYMDMMDPFMSIFGLLNIMGTAVAFAIIYNTATISLSERKREYATLRVLGMTIDEVCEIMGFEYWVLSVAGMLLGIPFASMLIVGVNGMMDTNMFSMPSALPFSAYITGAVGCSVAIILSNWSAKRKISKFDMVEVLKERE